MTLLTVYLLIFLDIAGFILSDHLSMKTVMSHFVLFLILNIGCLVFMPD